MTNSRPRICVLAFPRLARLIEEAAADFADQIELVIENRRFGDAIAQAHALIARGDVDGFISAGANGAQLRRQLDYAVALVQVSGFDIMAALVQAARLSKQQPPHIGLITYESVSAELDELSQLLKVKLHLARYNDAANVREQVEQLHALGVDVLIGPSLVTEAADKAGLASVFIYTREAAHRALEEALAAARVRTVEQARRRQLSDIIGQLHDGVLAIDIKQRIWLANPALCELIGMPEAALSGQLLSQVIPELDASGVLINGAPAALRRVFSIGRQRMIGNLVPLDENGVRHGAVLTVQAATSVERAGRDLLRHARSSSPRARHTLHDLIGDSHAMQSLRALAARFAALDLTVLIQGESGTGKELVAQGIHNASPRSSGPFVALNCAAMPETLLESELFGYEEGSFTGAAKGGKRGLLEIAHRGTVFLDEIGDMPAALQVKLLRVMQEREVLRIGGREPIPIDVRIIAATHRDLARRIQEGRFRQDLYYRVNGLNIATPALRAHREDLPQLISQISNRISVRSPNAKLPDALHQRFLTLSAHYDWPGNVRELENMLERLLAVAPDLPTKALEEVLALLLPELFHSKASTHAQPVGSLHRSLQHAREYAERARLETALKAAGGNLQDAAHALGISRTTLWRKLSRKGKL